MNAKEDDNLIEIVNELLWGLRHFVSKLESNSLEYPEQWTFEEINQVRSGIEDLKEADLYYLGDEFEEMLVEYGSQWDGMPASEIVFGEDTRLPSKLSFIVLEYQNKRMKPDLEAKHMSEEYRELLKQRIENNTMPELVRGGFMCRQYEDGTVDIRFMHTAAAPYFIGRYKPNTTNGLQLAKGTNPETLYSILGVCAGFDIINQPRFTVSEAAGTRQQRRNAKKMHGIAVEAWHKISWNIDEEPKETKSKGERTFKMPLHYTRGHWRKAQPHWDKTVIRSDGNPYIWIEGFWSGHPAYGIKKGYHAPTRSAA